MKYVILRVVLLLASHSATAQQKEVDCSTSTYEVGVSVGRIQYFGDLYNRASYLSSGSNWGLSGFLRKRINPYFGLRGNISIGNLSANDVDDPKKRWDYRRASFTTSFVEVAGIAEVYPFAQSIQNKRIDSYIFVGVGTLITNPKVIIEPGGTAQPSSELLAQDRQNLKKIATVFPVGLGVNYRVTPKLKAGLEVGYRLSTSDYIDGFSAASHKNSRHKDRYIIANIQVSYRLIGTDHDGDNVPDRCDACPRIYGLASLGGCPDADHDAIIDSDDSCPDEFGDPATCGCPDDDQDGIPNACDCCPTEKGDRAYHGCPKSHTIEYEHVRLPNTMRYCPLCPTNLPTVYRKSGQKHKDKLASATLSR